MFGPKSRILQFILQVILACLCSVTLATNGEINIREKEKAILDQILTNAKYDARIRPSGINGTDAPVLVNVSMYVRSIPNIDDVKQEYSVQLTFREQWVDERLKFDDMEGKLKYLSVTPAERIWIPDLFFSNEKESHFHNVLMPNALIRIFSTGTIYYSVRISLTLDCFMNFKSFPFDHHDCPLRMASWGLTTNDVVFLWKEGDPVQVFRSQEYRGFTLKDYKPVYCSTKSIAPEYSCLKVNFSFARDIISSLIRIYIPCCILVLASFVSFWLDQNAVTARVLLGVTTLLAMVVQVTNISASSPTVSYIKAVDIWMVVCLMFIFGTLLEFATLNYGLHCDSKRKCEQANMSEIHDDSNESMKTQTAYYKRFLTWLSKVSRSRKIDIISRIMFPISFALFNLAYWITYLIPDAY